MGLILGIVLASVIPLVFLGIIRKFDFYQTGQFKLILLSVVWGGIAYAPAALINNALKDFWSIDWSIIERFIAPILEEIFKGLVLFYLIRHIQITYSVDGALYGSAVGIGFAIVENFDYVTGPLIAMQRVLSANLVHPASSAILGITLGMSYLRRTRSRWMFLAAGLILAIGLHMFYNNIVYQGGASLASASGIGILGAVFIYLAMKRGKKQAQDWIREKLGMLDRVTPGEVALVNRLPSKDDLLRPVFERFGPEKAAQVEKLLYLQARLGIKRKFLDSIQKNDALHHTLDRELQEMRTEMLAAERALGTYTMLFVRGLYTDEMVSVWERMQAKIRERSAQNGAQQGGGLWSSLEQRLKSPSDAEGRE